MADHRWKQRSSFQHFEEDIFPEVQDDRRVHQSPPSSSSQSSKDKEIRKRSSSSSSDKDKDHHRHNKHKHNKHHHKHKKSKRKSRSRSKSPRRDKEGGGGHHRKRSRSRSREKSSRSHREARRGSHDGDREREKSQRVQRKRSRSGSRSRESSKKKDVIVEPATKVIKPIETSGSDYANVTKSINKVGGSNKDKDVDIDLDLANTAQPFSSGIIPPAASKLKAEIEKRKQLWGKKDKPATVTAAVASSTVWKKTAFSDDNDGKVSAKFKRLMGIKDDAPDTDKAVSNMSDKQRQEYFANLEKQYEVARATTHTQRGLGLGFSSRSFPR